ncbi:MAG: AMP-binding protein [Desulfobacterales bacterium]|nr:AMP-binding protein [Desulfobacterales bacterium]
MKELSSYERNVVRRASMGDMLVRTAARNPDKKVFSFRDAQFTYRQFNEAVNRCAGSLAKLGVKKGDRAAILSHNCHQFVIYWWALLKLGAIVTPLNFMLKPEEIEFIINHSEPVVFFVEDSLVENVVPVQNKLSGVKYFGFINLSESGGMPEGWMDFDELYKESLPAGEPKVEIYPEDPATLLYTSGTEANPKGVLNSHLNYYIDILSSLFDLRIREDARIITGIPLYHVAAMYLFTAIVAVGATTVMEYAPDPKEILDLTHNEKITHWVWPPALYTGLPMMPGFEEYDLSSLEQCVVFGSLAPPAVLEKWRKIVPEAGFMNYYGQTEMSPLGTSLRPEDFDRKSTSIGKAHMPLLAKVVDHNDEEVPVGQEGELVARGPAVMLGYYKDEEKTAQTFRNGWHHTGDLVRMDEEGFVYFIDRIKDVIKTGGENVASQEVEAMLYNCPGVVDAAVIGMPDEYWSEIVTAVVVPAQGQELTEEGVVEFCKEKLAGYKVPKKVIILDELPRNPSGKIIKKQLRQRFASEEKSSTA